VNRSKPSAAEGSITGADFLQLSIADAPPSRRSAWLAARLRTAIADGHLPIGSRLPASRVLAAELRVSRGVVTEAYQRLVEDGHVVGRGRGGTVVVAAPVVPPEAGSDAGGRIPVGWTAGESPASDSAASSDAGSSNVGSSAAGSGGVGLSATGSGGLGAADSGGSGAASSGGSGAAGSDAAGASAFVSGTGRPGAASWTAAESPASDSAASSDAGSSNVGSSAAGSGGGVGMGATGSGGVGSTGAESTASGSAGVGLPGHGSTRVGSAAVSSAALDSGEVGSLPVAWAAAGGSPAVASATASAAGGTGGDPASVERATAAELVAAEPAGAEPAAGHPAEGAESVSGGGGSPFGGVAGGDVFDALRAVVARVDLSPGVPDLAAFPRAAWLRAERAVLGSLAAADLGYGDPRGAVALRLAVSRWLGRYRGVRASADEVVIVAGVSQALALLAQVLGVPSIAVEDPGSLGTRQHLQNWGVDTPPVPVDSAGLLVSEISAPAVLVTPAHQFPTGVVMSGARRRELLGWASVGGVVIEDDYDAEHRYDRPPVPALRSMWPEVCYAGSVSKLLAPALRIGWLLVPPRLLPAIVAAKRNADLGNGVLAQYVLAHLMESGALEQQLRFLRSRHRRRRDAMISAIRTHLPNGEVHGAAAGLHLTVTFAGSFSDVDVAEAVLARGVKVQPLSWHRQRDGAPGLVLGYAARATAEIADGISVVGSVVRELQGRSRR
jgi:GntR family transcriptional regulator/MocR family aminotransferase